VECFDTHYWGLMSGVVCVRLKVGFVEPCGGDISYGFWNHEKRELWKLHRFSNHHTVSKNSLNPKRSYK
jgi:hypothetical protein